MTEKYMEIVIEAFLKTKQDNRYINISSFVLETGVDRSEITKYLRNQGWIEQTIGVFMRGVKQNDLAYSNS